jgi:hypothetical protein
VIGRSQAANTLTSSRSWEHAMRSGHAPGHIRDTFLKAIHAYSDWSFSEGGSLPTVTREIQ